MKICFIIDSIYNLGGAQRCTVMIANELAKRNYDVTIICTKHIDSLQKNDYGLNSLVKVLHVKMNNKMQKVLSLWTKIFIYINNETNLFKNNINLLEKIYYRKYKKGFKELESLINQNKYDVIIGVSSFFSIFITLLNIKYPCKLIGWQHSTSERYFKLKGEFLWHQDGLVNEAFKKLNDYIVLTKYDKEYLKTLYNYTATVVNNPCSFKTNKVSLKNSKIILAVGRYHKVKGFDLLIQAFSIVCKSHPDWYLKIVGEGPEEKNLKQLVKELNLENNVFITGKSKDLAEDYLNSSIFVLSSRMEGWGIVVTEAMEYALPIISFDVPCIHEIITDQEGIIAKYLNVDDLAVSINKLIENPDLRENMGENAKKRVKRFSIDNIIKDWEMVLNDKSNKENIK